MSSPLVELAVAVALMLLGCFGMTEGMASLRRGVYRHGFWLEQMSLVGIGVILLVLGGYMSGQALAVWALS